MKRNSMIKLRYYLRGVGIGIVFTGLVFGVVSQDEKVTEVMTKEEIITKAKEYGLVEVIDHKLNDLLSPTPTSTDVPETSATPMPTDSPIETIAPDTNRIVYYKFTVNQGDTPRIISQKLEKEGIIESAEEFLQFLKENEYTRKLKAGTYEIKEHSTISTIAKVLRGK